MPDAGITASAAVEKKLLKRIDEVYGAALKTAVKKNRSFLKEVEAVMSGKKKPHPYYNTPEKIAKWRQGYVNELLREHSVIDSIAKVLKDAGAELAPDIRNALAEIYAVNAGYTGQALTAAVKKGGINATFSIPTVRQAKIILEDAQPVMSKIAFSSLQDAPALIRRLQNEMAQAVLLGESQDRLIRRIADVMQDGRRRARRIAQTEGTRVQSQARYNTLKDGAAMGINVARRWSTRMVNSRESHIALNGKTVGMDENFVTIAGNVLRYPGDPTATAAEVINCHCVVVPVVGKRGESIAGGLQSGGEDGILNTGEMFHKKEPGQPRFKPISDARFEQLTIEARKNGAIIIRGTDEVEEHLAKMEASASTIGQFLLFSKDASVSDVLEETYHFNQNGLHINDDKVAELRTILNEIDVKKYIIENTRKYGVPRVEAEHIKRQLESYQKQLEEYKGGS